MAKILDSKPIAKKILNQLKRERKKMGSITLASVCIEKDQAQEVYISSQRKLAKKLCVDYRLFTFKKGISQRKILEVIKELNQDENITGIIIHKPLPSQWNEVEIFSSLSPYKDIEGLSPTNLGRIMLGNAFFLPPTVLSILVVLKKTKVPLYGKNVTIVGFSSHIGKPLSIILADRLATVSITHIATFRKKKLPFYLKNADIVISCVGKAKFIKDNWIKKGAIVIDVGISYFKGKVCGDVDFEKVKDKVSFITPVPGGVGVFTTLFLFQNLFKAANLRREE